MFARHHRVHLTFRYDVFATLSSPPLDCLKGSSTVEPQNVSQFQRLHHINSALAAFETCYLGLIFPQLLRQLDLREANGFPLFD